MAAELRYPALVKPSDPIPFKRRFGRPALVCAGPAELLEAFDAAAGSEPMLQEVVPGDDSSLWTVGTYTNAEGRPLGIFCGRKLLQMPRGFGTCRVGEARWRDDVVEQALALLDELGYHGIAQTEFRQDADDGTLRLMEVNPRLWQWHGLARLRRRPAAHRLRGHARPPARAGALGPRARRTALGRRRRAPALVPRRGRRAARDARAAARRRRGRGDVRPARPAADADLGERPRHGAAPAQGPPRHGTIPAVTPRARSRALDVLLLTTLTVTTWAKIHWSFAGQVALEDILAILFLLVFAWDRLIRRDWTLPRGAAALLLVLLGLEVVFLLGFFDLDTRDALDQYAKGMTKYLVHFVFLIAGVAHIVRRGKRFHLIAVGALCGGITLNAVYGVLQLLAKVGAGVNLDKTVVGPLTQGQGGVGGINVFGQATGVQGGSFVSLGVFRVNALALDPNHLGIMLCVPILILLPFALRMGVRTRGGIALAAVIAFCAVVEVLTLSRSGALGVAVGLLVLAIPLRRKLFSPKLVVPVLVCLLLVGVAASQSHYVRTIIKTRVTVSDRSAQVHYQIFALVPPVLDEHPLLGLGLNTFSVYYEFQTGRTDWGPHSFYVALIAETGLIGTTGVRALPDLAARAPGGAETRGPRARARRRPGRGARRTARRRPARRARRHDGRERLLPDDAVLLLLRARARDRLGGRAVRARAGTQDGAGAAAEARTRDRARVRPDVSVVIVAHGGGDLVRRALRALERDPRRRPARSSSSTRASRTGRPPGCGASAPTSRSSSPARTSASAPPTTAASRTRAGATSCS